MKIRHLFFTLLGMVATLPVLNKLLPFHLESHVAAANGWDSDRGNSVIIKGRSQSKG